MKRFLVGGAVRDTLMGRTPKDRDFVVLGGTPETMLAAGFRRVGGSTPDGFPVFLHPVTGEEHALARTERQISEGSDGRGLFAFATDPSVTLEADLARRDLTINAMALGDDGSVIDPFGGRADLAAGVLRHVGPAFAEDSLRVLRVARFAAKFGFSVAPETLALCQTMIGRLSSLPAERLAGEVTAALACDRFDLFVSTLRTVGALSVLMPEVEALYGVPQPAKHHPEIDTGVHLEMVLRTASRLSLDPVVRFMALVHDLGKGVTEKDKLPQHIGHEKAGVELVERMGARLRLPMALVDAGKLAAEFHTHVHRALEMKPGSIVKLFDTLRVRSDHGVGMLDRLLVAGEADARGRLGFEDREYPQAVFLRDCATAYRGVSGSLVTELAPERRKDRMVQLRVEAIKALKKVT